MLVNRQVISEMNLHLCMKKYNLNCFSYDHINLLSEMSTYGKSMNMWQMANLSPIAFAVLSERRVTMATELIFLGNSSAPESFKFPINYT